MACAGGLVPCGGSWGSAGLYSLTLLLSPVVALQRAWADTDSLFSGIADWQAQVHGVKWCKSLAWMAWDGAASGACTLPLPCIAAGCAARLPLLPGCLSPVPSSAPTPSRSPSSCAATLAFTTATSPPFTNRSCFCRWAGTGSFCSGVPRAAGPPLGRLPAECSHARPPHQPGIPAAPTASLKTNRRFGSPAGACL